MFSLSEETKVLIFALGEGAGNDMYDFGWVENIATADTVWKMSIEATAHAGGAMINRLINTSISLPAGEYQLRFKSDDSHSFNQWNTTPPEFAFYGITLFK